MHPVAVPVLARRKLRGGRDFGPGLPAVGGAQDFAARHVLNRRELGGYGYQARRVGAGNIARLKIGRSANGSDVSEAKLGPGRVFGLDERGGQACLRTLFRNRLSDVRSHGFNVPDDVARRLGGEVGGVDFHPGAKAGDLRLDRPGKAEQSQEK